ncbi:MAG: serine/threonine-protein phosphatase [Acidobacteriia bacterium]|nr:serine/threonine-protein phosphatase [Terriglobia bacterium]
MPEALLRQLNHLTEELENFEQIALKLKPEPGEIPKLPGIDVFGTTIPLAGAIGGDHIIYIDFQQRHDLDARIEQARERGQPQIAAKLEEMKQTAGVLLADVSGHRITDAVLAAMLHQAFLLGAVYELEMSGTITTRLFENINNRFYRSSSVRKFLTMIYGEIHVSGTFRFISAGHHPPLVFSNEFDRFVDIHPDLLISYPPIGTMPSKTDPDLSRRPSALGYKDKYTVNELKLMSPGDILVLYTDGLKEHENDHENYFPDRFESKIREFKRESARRILEEVSRDLLAFALPADDVSCVLIKKN